MANLLDWFGDRAKDVGRIIGTAADAVVPGNQANWHQPAPPRPVAPRPVAQPRPMPVAAPRIQQPSMMPSFNDISKSIVDTARSMPNGPRLDSRNAFNKLVDQANPFDNGKSWATPVATTNKSVVQQGQTMAKAFVKPFWETGDFIQQSGQVGVSNVMDAAGVPGAKENAETLRRARDESFQQGFARPADTVLHAADQVNPISIVERQGEENALTSEIDTRAAQANEARKRMLQDRLQGKISREEYKTMSDQLMAWQSEPSQKLQDVYTGRMKDLNAIAPDGSQKTPLEAGLGGAGDFLTLYTLGRNPISGAGLKAAAGAAGTTVGKEAAKEILLSNILNTTGQVASGVSNRLTPEQIAEQAVISNTLNTALMGAGYLHSLRGGVDTAGVPKTTTAVPRIEIDPRTGKKITVFAPRTDFTGPLPTTPASTRSVGYLVDGRPTTTKLYHGSQNPQSIIDNGFDLDAKGVVKSGRVYGNGVYLINDGEHAAGYAMSTPGGGVVDVSLPKDAKLATVSKDDLFNKATNYDPNIASQKYKDLGYDGIIINDGKLMNGKKVNEYVIFDPSILKAKDSKFNYTDRQLPGQELRGAALQSKLSKEASVDKPVYQLAPKAPAQSLLHKEAAKYKNVEDFQKALAINYEEGGWKGPKAANADELSKTFEGRVFHGTNAVNEIKTQGFKKGDYYNSGAYFSDKPDRAIEYMGQARSRGATTPGVVTVKLDNMKIKDLTYAQFREINKGSGGEELVASLKRRGFDGIKADGETLVWSTQKIKSPETLGDIYHQATGAPVPKDRAIYQLAPKPGPATGKLKISELMDSEGDKFDNYTKIPKGEKSYSTGKPIEVVKTPEGYMVLDGQHRAAEALASGKSDINAIVLSPKEAMKKWGDRVPWIEDAIKPQAAGNVPDKPVYQMAPKATKPGVKDRGLIETVKGADTTSPELATQLKSMPYKEIPNAKSLDDAVVTINKNPQGALNEVLSNKPRTTQLNAQGLILAEKAQQRGDFDMAQQIFKAMAPGNTKAGQTIQVLSVWGKTTPEGVVRYAQKVVDDANNVIDIGGGNPTLTLSSEKAQLFRQWSEHIQTMAEGKDKLIETQKMLNAIHQQVPASTSSKLQTGLYYAQLLNPKTAIRNVLGNTGMVVSENAKDIVGAPIDAALTTVRRIGGDKNATRSVYLPDLVGQFKAARAGGAEALKEARAGVNLSGQEGQLQIGNKQPAFRGPVGTKLGKAMQIELSVPDRAFYEARHFQTLKNEMRAAGVTKATKEMLDKADYDALYATFQDDSRASQAFVAIKKGLNKAGSKDGEFGLGSFVLNYPKTPGNLLSRGISYSPAGFGKSLVEMAKPLFNRGPFNQKAFVDSFSRATTGTVGLVGTGALLHNIGIITGAPSKDKDVNAADKNAGLGAYRINTSALKRYILSGFDASEAKLQDGDNLMTYDWFQPAAIGISMGANLDDTKGSDKGAAGKLSKMLGSGGASLAAGAETIAEQPLVQGLVNLTGKGQGLMSGLLATATGIPASFVPTILNQFNQVTDNTARSTYDPNPINEAANKVNAKIPYLSGSLQPQVGPQGEDNMKYQSGNGIWNVFLNPAFTSSYDATKVDKEISRLEDTTGQTSQYPALINRTQKVNGRDQQLTPQQITDMQRMQGTLTKAAYNGIMDDPGYDKLTDTERVKKLQNIITEANQIARIKVLGDAVDKETDKTVRLGVDQGKVLYNTKASGTSASTGSTDPKTKYQEALDQYEADKKAGLISDVQNISRQSSLTRLKAQKDYSTDAVELYGKSYKDIVSFVTESKNGKKLWEELQQLDKSMTAAGYTSKLFDRYGRFKKYTGKGTTSSGTKKAKKAKVAKTSGNYNAVRNIAGGVKTRKLAVGTRSPKYSVKSLPKIKKAKAFA